jgi:amino acid transporter
MAMSRDGLLPKSFGKINTRFQTPGFSTWVTGFFVGSLVLFIDDKLMTDLTSIGTLFAFVLVSGGVLMLPKIEKQKGKFSIPFINGKYIFPLMFLVMIYFFQDRFINVLNNFTAADSKGYLFFVFVIAMAILSVYAFKKEFSLIPLLGVSCCMYLMVEIPANSWFVFFCWMAAGLSIYWMYGRKNSRLNT